VISVINVKKLVANATANGDTPVNKQGLHFKLQFSQDPQKHKTFWVNCATGTSAGGSSGGGISAGGTSAGGSSAGGVSAGQTSAGGTSGVKAASTSVPSLPHAGAAADSAQSVPVAVLALLATLVVLVVTTSLGLVYRLLSPR
jgi:hypothetical protein